MEAIYRKQFTVHVSDVDFSQRLKLSSLFVYLQDMATEHAELLGAGRKDLERLGVIWVLIRAKVEVTKYPKWNEKISIETWPEEPDKIEFDRNFLVYDTDNNVVAKALTTWVLIDFNTRRLRRSSLINFKFPKADKDKALNCRLGRIKLNGVLDAAYKKTVGYSDIDMNEHLNNAKYVDYIMDCFSLDKHKRNFVKSIEVDYVHEALPGETIVLYTDMSELDKNIVYVEGINEDTSKAVFKSQIEIARKQNTEEREQQQD